MGRQLTVQQLKARLSEQGLATSGRKADLVQRLLEAAPLPEPAAPCAKAKPKPRTEPATRPPAKAKPAAKRRAKPSPRPAAAGALQDERRFFAACAGGLEAALEGELRDLGAADVQRKSRGVYFSGDSRLGCRVLIGARCANAMDEVLRASPQPLRDREELYSFVQEARPWPQVFPNHETLRVDTVLASRDVAEDIRHTHYSALTVCKAVCDACREATGARPSVSLHAPDWAFNLVLHREGATLARRWSGFGGLHRRGYRAGVKMHKGSLRETIAAGLLLLAGVKRGEAVSLLDPMCGSGTLVMEAAMLASDVAPGVVREALCEERWHAVPSELRGLLDEELDAARSRIRVPPGLRLRGSDAHAGALALARRCVAQLEQAAPGAGKAVHFELCGAADTEAPDVADDVRRLICSNPPWGARIGGVDDVEEGGMDAFESWRALAPLLQRHQGEAWLLTPDPDLAAELEEALGPGPRKPTRRLRVDGGIRDSPQHGARGLEWLCYNAGT